MSDQPTTPHPDNTRWTGAKAETFLKLLARHGKVARAARSVGMSRQAAYRLRARAPKFAEYWNLAMEQAALIRWERQARTRKRPKAVHPLLAKGE